MNSEVEIVEPCKAASEQYPVVMNQDRGRMQLQIQFIK